MKLPIKFRERYEPVAPSGFLAALEAGVPKTLRVNPLKTSRDVFLERVEQNRWVLEPLSWYPDAFIIEREDRTVPLGHSLEHFAGHCYIQEASSMVPPVALDPQPGERILDLAAAPGSKATQLAAMMDNRGLVVANDVSVTRIKALTANLERTGTLNTVVTNTSGHRLGRLLPGYFDRVLLDAPCSAEGTVIKNPEVVRRWSENASRKLSTLQGKLLLGAWEALRPGGTLVYSTCTFAPEENEVVLDDFLKLHPETELAPFDLPGLRTVPALASWQGRKFDPRTTHARRIWPGNAAMEGFFIAKLRKPPNQERGVWRTFTDKRYAEVPGGVGFWLGERFGMPADWDATYAWRGKEAERWLMSREVAEFTHAPIVRRGLRTARTVRRHGYKPTTDWAQLFGGELSDHVVELDAQQTAAYLAGRDIRGDFPPGYVTLKHADIVFAVGLGQDDKLKNQLPVSRRIP